MKNSRRSRSLVLPPAADTIAFNGAKCCVSAGLCEFRSQIVLCAQSRAATLRYELAHLRHRALS